MKKPFLRIAVLLAAVAGAAAFLAYQKFRVPQPTELHATGIVEGVEVNLSPKIAGRVAKAQACAEGDNVAAGQVVAILESEDVKASEAQAAAGVERARAAIRVEEAGVENARANLRSAESDEKGAAADIGKAEALTEEAARQADRRRGLFDRNLIVRESFDQSVTDSRVAGASLTAANEKRNAALARRESASEQLKAAESRLSLARAQRKEAEANLAFYRSKREDMIIRSPVAGTVVLKAFETGEVVSPGTTILTVVDLRNLYARVDVDETKVGAIPLSAPASVTAGGAPGKAFRGTVSEIGRYGEFATQRDVVRGREDLRTFRVKVRLDDPTGTLKPGMTVDVAFPVRR